MTSFVEFVISAFNYFGVFYIFAIILVACITFVIVKFIIKSFNVLDDKAANPMALLIAISSAILAMYIPNVVLLLQYFLAMTSVFLIIIFFIILFASFIFGEKKVPTKDYATATSLLIIILLMAFAFIALFYAYQDFFIKVNIGKEAGSSVNLFGLIWRPEVLLIVFIFVILGFGAWIIGRESGGGGSRTGQ